eukprot:TRINITY_DN3431_c0_g1_i1.p1 TRINITY_DN3431_c0_g1~~TRINITY_DN3431_c0_g1_i1.p1  ORF type:complete len:409 (-),score=57.64 TRINITY_DN3431_c0_g1_i1:86-1312(-)
MHFHRLEEAGHKALKEKVLAAIVPHLAPMSHERILLNFSKYEKGDFLDAHPDTPSGSKSYERRAAFVWHLSEDWQEGDGGLFVDEEAEDGPKHLIPSFNTLVTFAVPRWHSVTKVTSARDKQSPRFAAYGWVVVPRLEHLERKSDLIELVNVAEQNSVAVAYVQSRNCSGQLEKAAVEFVSVFSGLPVEKLGKGRSALGEICRFAITSDPEIGELLHIRRSSELAVVVFSEPFSRPSSATDQTLIAVAADRCYSILEDSTRLRSLSRILKFLNEARKVWSPCPGLDSRGTVQAAMPDLCFSSEVKVFIFLPKTLRTSELISRLDVWAASLRPRLRLLIADPCVCEPLLRDFQLSIGDVPTACADDTEGSLGKARLADQLGPRNLHPELLRQWLGCVAEAAGVANPQLR